MAKKRGKRFSVKWDVNPHTGVGEWGVWDSEEGRFSMHWGTKADADDDAAELNADPRYN